MYGIFTCIWLISMVFMNVGKYNSPMDPMGFEWPLAFRINLASHGSLSIFVKLVYNLDISISIP